MQTFEEGRLSYYNQFLLLMTVYMQRYCTILIRFYRYKLLPDKTDHTYNLRPRCHSFSL